MLTQFKKHSLFFSTLSSQTLDSLIYSLIPISQGLLAFILLRTKILNLLSILKVSRLLVSHLVAIMDNVRVLTLLFRTRLWLLKIKELRKNSKIKTGYVLLRSRLHFGTCLSRDQRVASQQPVLREAWSERMGTLSTLLRISLKKQPTNYSISQKEALPIKRYRQCCFIAELSMKAPNTLSSLSYSQKKS